LHLFNCRVNNAGSSLVYSTFLGGGDTDTGHDIAVDGAGNVYLTGKTYSPDFPTTPGAYDTSFNGDHKVDPDAFVSKLDVSGSSLLYSTFLGGDDEDYGVDIAVDDSGNAYATGRTYSCDFPTTPRAFDTSHNGYDDIFVAKLSMGALSGCINLKDLPPPVNMQVILRQKDEPVQITKTDANGCYVFENIASGKRGTLIIRLPVIP